MSNIPEGDKWWVKAILDKYANAIAYEEVKMGTRGNWTAWGEIADAYDNIGEHELAKQYRERSIE